MSVSIPTDLDRALAAVAAEPGALVLAGGTDAMVEVNAGMRRFESVVALRRVAELQRLTIEFEHAKVLSCDLKEGYYLVLVVASDANEGMAWQHLRVCRERLIKEL